MTKGARCSMAKEKEKEKGVFPFPKVLPHFGGERVFAESFPDDDSCMSCQRANLMAFKMHGFVPRADIWMFWCLLANSGDQSPSKNHSQVWDRWQCACCNLENKSLSRSKVVVHLPDRNGKWVGSEEVRVSGCWWPAEAEEGLQATLQLSEPPRLPELSSCSCWQGPREAKKGSSLSCIWKLWGMLQ